MSRSRLIALLLALATLAVYLPVARNGFILYDDGDYVTANKVVQAGLTPAGIKWAFTTFHSANWHPLTWLSHMTDCELFGLSAAGPHCVNALLHAANTVLLFALWLRLTRREPKSKIEDWSYKSEALWPSAFIAALFALHPLHVESVAWVAERKDVLSAFFGLLTLLCYARYAMEDRGRLSGSYWMALFFFACGLMSKPMLVTFPFVMLLLDYWPLKRLNAGALKRLLAEKTPFFLLTAMSCIVTYFAQSIGAVKSLAAVPLVYRLENAPIAVAAYLFKMIWPARLAVIYPMPAVISPGLLIGCLAVLIFISLALWLARKQNPCLLVGWLWFLGTLVPVLGLVKVGDAAMADRYTYVPSIGIFMAVAFGTQKFSTRLALPKFLMPAMAALILVALAVVTERQLSFWRDDASLFSHAMRVTNNNVDAILNYGVALENEGKPVQAMAQYRRVEKIAPSTYLACTGLVDLLYACSDLGNLLYYAGKPDEALEQYRRAARLNPVYFPIRDRMGIVLASLGRFAEATNEFYNAIRLKPAQPLPHLHLGIALAAHNDFTGATSQFSEALQLDPGDPSPLMEWARALLQQGRDTAAMDKLRQALQLDPNNFQTLAFTARVLASDESPGIRDGAAALALAQKADALTDGSQPLIKDALGMAYAQTGQFDDAQKAANDAITLAIAAGMKEETVAAIKERLRLYEKRQPWRESFLLSNSNEHLR